tara:strand:+ start:240 stop:962 length:723 start_codon:yes stop_codon:yes gene_type:complete
MTIAEMHLEYKIFRDAIDSSAYPEMLDEEIDITLNEAMDRIVKTRYGKNNLYRKGFEESQKRTDDLKELVVSRFPNLSLVSQYTSIGKRVFQADLSPGGLYNDAAQTSSATEEYMFYIKADVLTVSANCPTGKRSSINLVQQDDLYAIQGDPFNSPSVSNPVGFFEEGNLFVQTSNDGTVSNLLITFIKRPIRMDLSTLTDCELSEHLHKEIVQMAVDISLENLQSPRVQTNIKNIQTIE